MDRIRWGIAGTGAISASIAPDFRLAENATVVAVASRSIDSANRFGDDHDIRARYGTYEQLLRDPYVDAVYIGTPHGVHHRMALEALEAGKHVLVEKPFALNGYEVRDILDRAERAGLFAMEAMWSNFSPTMALLVDSVNAGEIGEVRSVHASFGVPFPRDHGSRWSAELGGSTLLDQGIYPIALAHALLGLPRSMKVGGHVRSDGVDLAAYITLEYDDHRHVHIAASMVEFAESSATINGTSGWISVPAPFWVASSLSIHNGGVPAVFIAPQNKVTTIEGNGFVPMIRAASSAILQGWTEHPLHPRQQTLEVFAIIDEIKTALNELAED